MSHFCHRTPRCFLQCVLRYSWDDSAPKMPACRVFRKMIGAGFSRIFSLSEELELAGKEKDNLPKATIDVVNDKIVGDEEKHNEKHV